jgi:hypothetical protein
MLITRVIIAHGYILISIRTIPQYVMTTLTSLNLEVSVAALKVIIHYDEQIG